MWKGKSNPGRRIGSQSQPEKKESPEGFTSHTKDWKNSGAIWYTTLSTARLPPLISYRNPTQHGLQSKGSVKLNMQRDKIHRWKKAPFLQLLPALVAGILLQWYASPREFWWIGVALVAGLVLSVYLSLPSYLRFRFRLLQGVCILSGVMATGGWITAIKDIRKQEHWVGQADGTYDYIAVALTSSAVQKQKTSKAEARILFGLQNKQLLPLQGNLLLYFRNEQDSAQRLPVPGSILLLQPPLQEIRNSGNPGAFDYRQYCFFRGITHQVFLTPADYVVVPGNRAGTYRKSLLASQQALLDILRKYIPGTKEKGLAEALLIGYKHDLDPELVQSYSNTGVVHIIAISGLHLGLIYWLLQLLLQPLARRKAGKWLRPLLIIAGLWAFSLLAGAQPSVLRSALLFTMLVLAGSTGRKTSVFNSLAASATILLLIQPYWLWDPGFQLSYAAVTSILLFMKPVYHLLYFSHRLPDLIWKMNAVTLSAQILTLPLTIFYFHQFPLVFLLSNLIAVPLSSLILLVEILLMALSFFPEVAALTGQLISLGIRLMNTYMEYLESIPGALWDGLQISFVQALLLLVIVTGLSAGYLEKKRSGLLVACYCLPLLMLLRSHSFIRSEGQQKIIVYNISGQAAIDCISGRNCYYRGDPVGPANPGLEQYTLKPSRILHRVQSRELLPGLYKEGNFMAFAGKRILFADSLLRLHPSQSKVRIDLLILSGNARVYFRELVKSLDIRQVVADGSVRSGKITYWKRDCDSLQIPFHAVRTEGAFVMNLN